MSGASQLEALLKVINISAGQAIAEYQKDGHDVPTVNSKTFHPIDFASDNVALRRAVRQLESACQRLCASLALPQNTLVSSAVPTAWACARVVVRAKVADVLEKYPGGLPVDELSKLVNLEKGKLARVLRLLATKGCFVEVEPNTFANNRVSLVTLSRSYTGAFSRLLAEDVAQGATVLYETMTEPEYASSYHPEAAPFFYALKKKGLKGNYFDLLKEDAERQEIFHRAMIGDNHSMGALSVLHRYPWEEVNTVCDVGSGVGAVSQPLSKAHLHLKIINQDLPEVLAKGKDAWAKDSPEVLEDNRVEFIPLDFLEEGPVSGQDVYYLRNIIHDWPDAEALTILRNVRNAMAPHSRLLIHGAVLPPVGGDTKLSGSSVKREQLLPGVGNWNDWAYQQDLMMWFAHNAKERTSEELSTLCAAAGLRFEKMYDLSETAVLEFRVA